MVNSPNSKQVAKIIDHTLLEVDATQAEILQLCAEACEYGFFSVCIRSEWLKVAREALKGSSVMAITVVGFPSGEESRLEKVNQTKMAIENGAQEIDMVLNRTLLKKKEFGLVYQDIRSVVEASGNQWVKVILETSELSLEEKVEACTLVKAAGANFVKTSTGFTSLGATTDDITLMRRIVGPEFGVKASGGVRSWQDAVNMVNAGATRLGTSASVAIIQKGHGTSDY